MSAAGSIWMPLYPRDYLADTQGLDAEQSGAYLHLLMHSWTVDQPLPDDDAELATISRVSLRRWKSSIRAKVIRFFYKVAGGFRQKRLEHEREKARNRSAKAAIGGNARGLQRQQHQQVNSEVASPKHVLEPSPLPVPSPSQVETRKEEGISRPSVARRPMADKPVSKPPEIIPDRVVEQPPVELVLEQPAPPRASSDAETAVTLWNAMAAQQKLPQVKDLTDQRRARLMKILRRHGLKGWRDMLDEIPESEFALGINDSGWRINFDYVIRPEAFAKTLEGGHRRGPGKRPKETVLNMAPDSIFHADLSVIDEEFDERAAKIHDLSSRRLEHA